MKIQSIVLALAFTAAFFAGCATLYSIDSENEQDTLSPTKMPGG